MPWTAPAARSRPPCLRASVRCLLALGLTAILTACGGAPTGASNPGPTPPPEAPSAATPAVATAAVTALAATAVAVPTTAVEVPPVAAPPGGAPPDPDADTEVQGVGAPSDDQPRPGATPGLRPSGSSLEEHTFFSPTLGEEMLLLVYLPAGYEETDRRYPTVYMLHGVAGGPSEWPEIGIPDAADRLIADGTIQPMVIVFPNADASYYVNGATSGLRWQDYLVRDVVAHVDTTYRTFSRSESRAVSGLSMGGDGALQLAMRFPDVFGVAAAHSPSSRLLFEHAAADVYGSEAYFRAHNPFWLAQEVNPEIGIRVWIDVGDEDPWRWNARAIHAALQARGLDHEFNLLPGLHEGDYWVAHVDDYLQFYDRALVGPSWVTPAVTAD